MIDPIWSWILPIFGIAAVWVGPVNRWGWALGLCGQCLWLIYGLTTHQHGFVLSALLFGGAHLKNFLAATRRESLGMRQAGGQP